MLELMHEGGMAPWVALLVAVAGLAAVFTVGRKRGRPGSVAACFAVAVLAIGAAGQGTGQRNVDGAVRGQRPAMAQERHDFSKDDLATRLEVMSVGTREAAANQVFAGLCATLLMAVGGAAAVATGRRQPA